jgi:hypothetical protein
MTAAVPMGAFSGGEPFGGAGFFFFALCAP